MLVKYIMGDLGVVYGHSFGSGILEQGIRFGLVRGRTVGFLLLLVPGLLDRKVFVLLIVGVLGVKHLYWL